MTAEHIKLTTAGYLVAVDAWADAGNDVGKEGVQHFNQNRTRSFLSTLNRAG